MKHICTEHEESWMKDVLCSEEGCNNLARHDWVVSLLCCAHDHIMNLLLVIDQKDDEIKMLRRGIHDMEVGRTEWYGSWLEGADKVEELENAASIKG